MDPLCRKSRHHIRPLVFFLQVARMRLPTDICAKALQVHQDRGAPVLISRARAMRERGSDPNKSSCTTQSTQDVGLVAGPRPNLGSGRYSRFCL